MIERIRRELFDKIEAETKAIDDIIKVSNKNGIEIGHTEYESKIKELAELKLQADSPMDLKKSNEMNKSLRKILVELVDVKKDLMNMIENNAIIPKKEHFPELNITDKDTVDSLEIKKAVISKLKDELAQKKSELKEKIGAANAPLQGGKEVTKAELQAQLERVRGTSKLGEPETVEQDKTPKKQ